MYLIELGNINSVTESSGVVTAITKASGKIFRKYALIRETSMAEEKLVGNRANGTVYYSQQLQIVLNKRQANTRNEIMLLAQNLLAAVVIENTGKAFLYGRVSGLMLDAADSPTGTAWGDRNGYTLTFTGNETALAPEVQASVITGLQS